MRDQLKAETGPRDCRRGLSEPLKLARLQAQHHHKRPSVWRLREHVVEIHPRIDPTITTSPSYETEARRATPVTLLQD